MQKLSPDSYAALALPDQFLEDQMQIVEAAWLVEQTKDCATVLDLGYGSGIVCKALHGAGRAVTVIDGAESSAAEVQRAGMQAVWGMFEDAVTPLATYDCVIASFVLEHVADPVALLRRCAEWAPRLIAVVGNANSWHRRLAVKMGLQPELDTLSPRDHAVGHYRVYSPAGICKDLFDAGWKIKTHRGFQFKPLPNAMMMHFDERLIRAMCEIEVAPLEGANIGFVCERK